MNEESAWSQHLKRKVPQALLTIQPQQQLVHLRPWKKESLEAVPQHLKLQIRMLVIHLALHQLQLLCRQQQIHQFIKLRPQGESCPTSSAAASADAPVKTGSTSRATSKSNLRDASNDWVLKSLGLKGSHQIAWPTKSSSFPTASLTTGLDEAIFVDDQHEWLCFGSW